MGIYLRSLQVALTGLLIPTWNIEAPIAIVFVGVRNVRGDGSTAHNVRKEVDCKNNEFMKSIFSGISRCMKTLDPKSFPPSEYFNQKRRVPRASYISLDIHISSVVFSNSYV